jgi:hypothetical protein
MCVEECLKAQNKSFMQVQGEPLKVSNFSSAIHLSQPKKSPSKVENKRPNYDFMNAEEIQNMRIKFEGLYQKLVSSYKDSWNILEPNYYTDPIDQIHERYENIVKRIVIYQTAQRWKVYLAIAIVAIEYLGYKRWKWQIMKDFAKIQLKTIHKYDHYLIELATSWYDQNEEDWPFLLRAAGTMGSNIVVFILINWVCSSIGLTKNEKIHELADQFVSDGDSNAVLKNKNDNIPEVPEPPSGITSPDNIINMLTASLPLLFPKGSSQQNKTGEDAIPRTNNDTGVPNGVPVAEPATPLAQEVKPKKRSAVY